MTTDATKYLGGYVGLRETCDQLTRRKVGKLITHLEKLSELAKAEPHAAYSYFVSRSQDTYTSVQRVTPPSEQIWKQLEETIRNKFFTALFGCDISEELRKVLLLPVKMDGMAIHDPTDTAITNYASSRKVCDQHIQLLFDQQKKYPEDMPQIQTQEIEKIRQEKEAHQKALRATTYSEASQQLKWQLDHVSRAGASSWFSATQLKESDRHLSKSDFRDLIRLRYLLSLENMPLTCVCGKDYLITHALTCATGWFNIKRHNDVQDYLANLLNEMCADVSIEPHLVQVTEDETTSTNREDAARLDIAARDFWWPSQWAFFDIRVFNANAQSSISRNIEETFSHHEREKARKYSDRIVNVEHGSFTPLIVSTHGDYSQLTSRFIYQLAKFFSRKPNICFSE